MQARALQRHMEHTSRWPHSATSSPRIGPVRAKRFSDSSDRPEEQPMTESEGARKLKNLDNVRKRWKFGELKRLPKPRPEARPRGGLQTEIMIMMPMDTITVVEVEDGVEKTVINHPSLSSNVLDAQLLALKDEGATGIMLDVWWGICERKGPKQYDFDGYITLLKKVQRLGMKAQAVMSFHQGGGNVGDGAVFIPLPDWVLEAGEQLQDEIFYTDKDMARDHECLSLGCDHEPVVAGRTPIQLYTDFIQAFAQACTDNGLWGSTIEELVVGLGPCGELRYPAYQESGNKWSYFGPEMESANGIKVQRGIPGIGEFQCYDAFMLRQLEQAAAEAGHPEWGKPPAYMPGYGSGGPDFAPWETEFFALAPGTAGFEQPYGKFFMEWYSGKLVQHAKDVFDAVIPVVREADVRAGKGVPPMQLGAKIAGIHWWYKARSHPAEMTAGYYNFYGNDGYEPIMRALAERDVGFAFTCIEMSDDENPDLRHCSPEGLVRQIIDTAERVGCKLMAENALEGGLYSQIALERMARSSKHFSTITLLRLSPNLFLPAHDGANKDELLVRQPLRSFLNKFLDTHEEEEETSSAHSQASNGQVVVTEPVAVGVIA